MKFNRYQVPHFMIVLIFFKPFLENEMSVFEESAVFNHALSL